MDAKWNWVIDNQVIRKAINGFAFVAWYAVALGILEFAAKY